MTSSHFFYINALSSPNIFLSFVDFTILCFAVSYKNTCITSIFYVLNYIFICTFSIVLFALSKLIPIYILKHISRKIVSFTVWSTLHERCEARKKPSIFLWCDDCFHWKSKTVYFLPKENFSAYIICIYIVLIMRFNYAVVK